MVTGALVGVEDGFPVGVNVGIRVDLVGALVGALVGVEDGFPVGINVGIRVGDAAGGVG